MTVTRDAETRERYQEAALIPKERYTSREFLQLEYERLWPHVWQLACREEEIPNVGDFLEYTIGDQSILVVRTEPDTVKAYHNACLHRGTQLRAGVGHSEELRCRFHGWCWNLDGTIREIPDARDFAPECVVRSEMSLPEVLADTWGGFVYVNMDLSAPPLLEYLDPLPAYFDKYEPEKMRMIRYRTTIMQCNWKAGLDAFNEAYHLSASHVQDLGGIRGGDPMAILTRPSDENRSGATAGGAGIEYWPQARHNLYSGTEATVAAVMQRPISEIGPDPRAAVIAHLQNQVEQSFAHVSEIEFVRSLPEVPADATLGAFLNWVRRETASRDGADLSHLTDYDMLRNLVGHFFPNMVGPIVANNWILFRFRPNGDDPDTCIFDVYFLHRFPEGEAPPVVHEWYPDWRDHDEWGITLMQDLSNMAFVQRGMHDNAFPGIRLGRQEVSIRNMHRNLEQYLGLEPGAV